jgi:hypothetical protein
VGWTCVVRNMCTFPYTNAVSNHLRLLSLQLVPRTYLSDEHTSTGSSDLPTLALLGQSGRAETHSPTPAVGQCLWTATDSTMGWDRGTAGPLACARSSGLHDFTVSPELNIGKPTDGVIAADYIRERRILRNGYLVVRFTAIEAINRPSSRGERCSQPFEPGSGWHGRHNRASSLRCVIVPIAAP